MSNLWFNIRFGTRHLQISRARPHITFSRNPYQAELRVTDPAWRWFEVMEAPWIS